MRDDILKIVEFLGKINEYCTIAGISGSEYVAMILVKKYSTAEEAFSSREWALLNIHFELVFKSIPTLDLDLAKTLVVRKTGGWN